MFLHLLTMLLVLLFFQQKKQRAAGFLTAGGIIGFGVLFTAIKSSPMWLFPFANTVVWLHYTEILRKTVVPIAYSYIYFAVLLALLIVMNIAASRSFSVDTIEETGA